MRLRSIVVAVIFAASLVPFPLSAEEQPVTRRDGFLLLWQSIRRATQENREPFFTDVPAGSPGEEEITYAKYRGILDDDDERFYPDESLMAQDGLLWLLRTRSVDDIDELTAENLPRLVERYALGNISGAVTEAELLSFMRSLDGQLVKEDHEVSLYAEKFHGKGTAFGETFDMNALTAAHRTFPHNTLVKVTNLRNGKSITVRINDRGPYVEGRDMDLSLAAFTSIEDRSKGILRATFQRLGDARLVTASCSAEAKPPRSVRISGKVHLIGGIPTKFTLGETLTLRSTRPFVVRGVRYPDGNALSVQDWVLPGESHAFTPSIEGEYVFRLSTATGRNREMRMEVVRCG